MGRPKGSSENPRRLVLVSKRRQPTEDGLARLVTAMVLHRLRIIEASESEQIEEAP